ncbi:MAG: hypothetical protein KF819_32765 [Labilithrix sp.]|nr:hypothetical protein [Labilithrix sp.]
MPVTLIRRHVTPPFVGVAALLAGMGSVTDARAKEPSKDECISTNEAAQTLRQTGKLREARAQLLVCTAKSCPGPVRDDCAQRLDEVDKATPTIVFAAKAAGADLSAVRVTMDGSPLAERLDGSPLTVDPGEHTFEFATAGYPNVSRRLLIAEGTKGRQEIVVFAATTSPPVAPAPAAPPITAPSEPFVDAPAAEVSSGSSDGQRTLAYVLGGAGIVGLGLGAVFGVVSKSTYDDALLNCPSGPSSCNDDGVAGGKSAHTQATVSTISFIAGGALLAGGITLLLTRSKSSALNVQPMAGATAAGIRLEGAW